MLSVLNEKVLETSDKAIIVSQWPSFLGLIALHLKANRVKYDQLDGKVPVNKRMEMVDAFNDPNNKLKVSFFDIMYQFVFFCLIGIAVITDSWRGWIESSWWKSFVFTRFTLESTA